jgi:glycosyltransferase involved in cell wall biosynthesis
VLSLAKLLSGAGYKVAIASFDSPDTLTHFNATAPIYKLGPIPRLPLLFRPWAYALSASRLSLLKRKLGVDVTISNLWRADLISQLSRGADRKLALCHINIIGNFSNQLMVRFRPVVALVYRLFDHVIAVSYPLAQELRDLYGLASDRIRTIENFTESPSSIPDKHQEKIKRFIWCGRFVPEKNVTGLLHAWADFANLHTGVQLVLLGEGPLRRECQILANKLGSRVAASTEDVSAQLVFLGKVTDPANYMIGAQALLLSSTAEGLPMVILEALAHGLPVLASDCPAGGVRSALADDVNPLSQKILELTSCGALLPIPDPSKPNSLKVWSTALSIATFDTKQSDTWRLGALMRANRFSSQAALRAWQHVLVS